MKTALVIHNETFYFAINSAGKDELTGIKLSGKSEPLITLLPPTVPKCRYCNYWLEFYAEENGLIPDEVEINYHELLKVLIGVGQGGFYDYDRIISDFMLDAVLAHVVKKQE